MPTRQSAFNFQTPKKNTNHKSNKSTPPPKKRKGQAMNTSSTFTEKPLPSSKKLSNYFSFSNAPFQQFPNSLEPNHDQHYLNENQQNEIYDDDSNSKIPFTKQPSQRIFYQLKKRFNSKTYIQGQIIFAKCEDEPLWPAKILQIETIPGLLPEQTVFHVKFINQSGTTIVNSLHMLKFNQQTVEKITEVTNNKKVLKAIKMAEKQLEKKNFSRHQSESNDSFNQIKTYLQSQIIQSSGEQSEESRKIGPNIFSSQQKGQELKNKDTKNKISLEKRQSKKTKNKMKKSLKKPIMSPLTSENSKKKSISQKQSLKNKIKTFEPIVLIKQNQMQISFEKGYKGQTAQEKQNKKNKKEKKFMWKDQFSNSPETLTKDDQRGQQKSNKKKIGKGKSKRESAVKVLTDLTPNVSQICVAQEHLRPMNFIIETPRIPSNFYLNKIIFNFQHDEFHSKSEIQQEPNDANSVKKPLSKRNKNKRNQTKSISQQNLLSHTYERTAIARKQVIPLKDDIVKLSKDTNSSDIEKYLEEYINDIERVTQILHRSQKQKNILNFFTRPLHLILIKQNYLTYDNIVKLSIQVVQKSQNFNINELFCKDLAVKLKLLAKRMKQYDGTNRYVVMLKKLCLKKLEEFLKIYDNDHESGEENSESENQGGQKFQLESPFENKDTVDNCEKLESAEIDLEISMFNEKRSKQLNQNSYKQKSKGKIKRRTIEEEFSLGN